MLSVVPASDRSLLVRCGDALTPEAHRSVLRLLARLEAGPPRGLLDWSPASASILLRFDPRLADHASLETDVRALAPEAAPEPGAVALVEIVVRYGGEDGPDLADVARASGLSTDAAVGLHASRPHDVLFLGFCPGFA